MCIRDRILGVVATLREILIALRPKLHATAEDVVDAGGVKQHEGHPDHGKDEHYSQRIRRRRGVEDGQVVLRVEGRNQQFGYIPTAIESISPAIIAAEKKKATK